LKRAGIRSAILKLADGERNKRLQAVERLAEGLLARGADRGDLLAAVGGGVVGDVTGFLAASYMRGIGHVQIPTTLVAQVDSAVGGKTGVNLKGGKNLLGAFHNPLGVIVDPIPLGTLPGREYRAGLYEVVKYAILGDRALFRYLERNLPAVLSRNPQAVMRILLPSIRLKARIVTQDERESDRRRVLNLGHTFGHAFEALTGYGRLRHGEAIGWGLLAATNLARRTGRLSQESSERIGRLVLSVGPLPNLAGLCPGRIYTQMFSDKKKKGRSVTFVLPRRIGGVEITSDVRRQDVLASLSELPKLAASR
jgi:3-dehydroquinate synthase